MAVFSWVDGKSLQALTKCKNEGKVVYVEVCNEFGETGLIEGRIATNPVRRILNDFTLEVDYGKQGTHRLNIKLDRENIEHGTSLVALRVVDKETKKVIYNNPNREIWTHPELYDGNKIRHLEKIAKVKESPLGAKLLKNIGQFVEIKDEENDFHSVKGVIKSIYIVGEEQVLHAKIVLGSDAMAYRRLNGDEELTITQSKAEFKKNEKTEEETF